jgi:hypothetical protein
MGGKAGQVPAPPFSRSSRYFQLFAYHWYALVTPKKSPILYSAVPATGSADAETVNDRLEARIGTDCVILRIDVDE